MAYKKLFEIFFHLILEMNNEYLRTKLNKLDMSQKTKNHGLFKMIL